MGVDVGVDGRHSQPLPPRSTSRTEVRLNLSNLHPQVEDDPEHDLGIIFVMSAVD